MEAKETGQGKVSVGKIDSMESGSSEVQREVEVEDGR